MYVRACAVLSNDYVGKIYIYIYICVCCLICVCSIRNGKRDYCILKLEQIV